MFKINTTTMKASEIARKLEANDPELDRYLGEAIYNNTDPEYLRKARLRLAAAARLHADKYNDPPSVLLRAPGRLNAFLEYLDMCAGDHMSTTIDGDLPACISFRNDDTVRTFNAAHEFEPTEFSISAEIKAFISLPWEDHADLEDNWDNRTRVFPFHGHKRGDWMNYVRGPFLRVAWELRNVELKGVDISFGKSTIPMRGGTSSSSALVVISYLALHLANQDRLPGWDIAQICGLLGEAEWYVGTHGGANDQTTIVRSSVNGVLYNRHSRAVLDSTPLPSLKGVKMVMANSLWEANKSLNANHVFNLRKGWMDLGDDLMKLLIDRAVMRLGDAHHSDEWLQTLIREEFKWEIEQQPVYLESNTHFWADIFNRYNKFGSLDTTILGIPNPAIEELVDLLPEEISPRRAGEILGKDIAAMERDYTLPYDNEGGYKPKSAARFFMKENIIGRRLERIFLEADTRLKTGDTTVDSAEYEAYRREVGRLLEDLQATLRDDFQVSCYQLDSILDIAKNGPGYLGGKLTGAGCGGCVVVMVEDGTENAFCEYLDREYYAKPENFSVYRNTIDELTDRDIGDSLRANLDAALADIKSQRKPVTFSAGANAIF